MILQEVLPGFAASDNTDVDLAHPECFGQECMGQTASSDGQYFSFGQFCSIHSLASGLTISFDHLPGVVSIVSGVQVGGLTADRTIAPMQDTGSRFCDRVMGVVDLVCHDMGKSMFPGAPEYSVPIRHAARPVPTPLGGRFVGHMPFKGLNLREVRRLRGRYLGNPQRVTVSPPSHVMRFAPLSGIQRPATIIDRTHELHYKGEYRGG